MYPTYVNRVRPEELCHTLFRTWPDEQARMTMLAPAYVIRHPAALVQAACLMKLHFILHLATWGLWAHYASELQPACLLLFLLLS